MTTALQDPQVTPVSSWTHPGTSGTSRKGAAGSAISEAVVLLSWEWGQILPGKGWEWEWDQLNPWVRHQAKAPGNSLPGRLKSPWVSAPGVLPLHLPGHGESAWETRWISGFREDKAFPVPEGGSSVPATPRLLQLLPSPPRQFLEGTQLHLSHFSFPAPCRQKEKPFPTLMLFDLCGFISTWREEEESIIPHIH